MDTIIKLFTFAKEKWESKSGPVYAILALLFCYYLLLGNPFKTNLSQLQLGLEISSIILISVTIYIVWLFTTKRRIYDTKNELIVAIHVTTDESNINAKIKSVVEKTILDINDNENLEKYSTHLLPINLIERTNNSTRYLEKYFNSRKGKIHTLINLNIRSGHFDEIEKMEIDEIDLIGLFNAGKENKRVYFDEVNLVKDMSIVHNTKNWEYIYKNDGNDKIKIKDNLKEVIMFYSGIYAIYMNNYNLALNLLLSIFKPDERQIKVANIQNAKIRLEPKNIVASRLASILLNLYVSLGFTHFENDEKEKALQLLFECETLLKKNRHSYTIHLLIARMSFESGDITNAKKYTTKAKSLYPNAFEIPMNYGWFAAIENSPYILAKNFKRLHKLGKQNNRNYIELIEFVNRYKKDYPDTLNLLLFIEGFYYQYVDKKFSNEILSKVLEDLSNDDVNKQLKLLINDVLGSKPKRKINNSNTPKRKRKKKRR